MVADETWKRGRVAGFADGVLANGTRITAMVDTREDELKDLFRDFGRKNPDQVLRGIEDEDVWVTTGDDSTSAELAPTSGKLYLKVERDNNFLVWGDFKPVSDLDRVVRTDRTLYGLMGNWQTTETMPNGEARLKFTGYASQPDSLVQRDIFRGTGGSSYFLSRRDIQSGTETLIVEIRDPVSGRVVESRRLTEGRDYRIDYLQGVVILNAPLSPSAMSAAFLPVAGPRSGPVTLCASAFRLRRKQPASPTTRCSAPMCCGATARAPSLVLRWLKAKVRALAPRCR